MKNFAAHVRLLLIIASASTMLAAQAPTKLTGKVEKAPANPCHPDATHRVGCTDVLLSSGTAAIDLDAWLNKIADLEGTVTQESGCVMLAVTSVVDAPQKTTLLALFGTRLNQTILFTTTAPAGAIVLSLFSFGPGFVPLPLVGTYLLDITRTTYWTATISLGVALQPLKIPNDSTLVGLEAYYQFAWVTVTPTLAGGFANPGCFKVTQ